MDSGSFYPDYPFPPAARLHEYVAVVRAPGDYDYYRVDWLEPIPVYTVKVRLGASQTLYDYELAQLKVGRDEVLQARLSLGGPARVRVRLPRALRRYTLRNETGWVDHTIAGHPAYPPQTELHVLEDTSVYLDIENILARPAAVKLYFTGWRLVLTPVAQPPRTYTALIVQGFTPRV